MALITQREVEAYCGATAGSAAMAIIVPAVEQLLDTMFGRALESAAATERYDGTGTQTLFLDRYPVTAITRLAIGTDDALDIENSSTDASDAIINVTTTALTLEVLGGTNAHASQSFTLASYTLATLATAITAYAHGWTAEVSDTANNSYPATVILPCFGEGLASLNAFQPQMPTDRETGYIINSMGRIYLPGNVFACGNQNIIVTYTAGYTSSTLPADIKLFAYNMCKEIFQTNENSEENISSYSIGNITRQFLDAPPWYALKLIDKYTRQAV